MSQPIQIVDGDDKPIRAASKQEAWKGGLPHRVIRIMVLDERGRVLLQKRAPTKEPSPNRWDNSVAGHVDAGEDYDTAAKREFHEELGIDADQYKFKVLGKYRTVTKNEWRKLDRFQKIYEVTASSDLKYEPNPREISEVRWFEVDELKDLIRHDPKSCTSGVREVFARYYS